MLVIIVGFFYRADIRERNKRFDKGEKRMRKIETELHTTKEKLLESEGQHKVLQEKVDGLKELCSNRLDTLSDSMNRVEDLCANLYREDKR
tara:strand:- start:411 stop:683 length:273 start_codon:yes stop_codon:yes gene_type:complete